MTAELRAGVMQAVEGLRPELDSLAADIHADPETGWQTPRAVQRLTAFLAAHGLQVERGLAGLDCAFRAVRADRFATRPAVCLLAEFDALPGLGHACGHNLIGTAACGAAVALGRVLDEAGLPGAVYVMGTPFEEGGGGKVVMVREGVFDVADASLMFHPGNRLRVGSPNIAAQLLVLSFHGRAAHAGAAPQDGVNAADAAMLTFAGINALRQHVTADVRIHGIVTDGGRAANIVPDFARVELQVRARNRSALEAVRGRVLDCARGGALAAGARLEVEEGLMFFERLVLRSYRQVALDNLPALGLAPPAGDPQTFASADSGNVSHRIPHLTFNLPITDDPEAAPHTPQFNVAAGSDRGRATMVQAAQLLALCALDLLTRPGLLATIQAEHRERLAAASA